MKKRKRRIIAVLLCWMLCGTTASGAVQEGEVTTTIRSGEVRIRMHRYGDEKKEKGTYSAGTENYDDHGD